MPPLMRVLRILSALAASTMVHGESSNGSMRVSDRHSQRRLRRKGEWMKELDERRWDHYGAF
jgi:hypothetical protein